MERVVELAFRFKEQQERARRRKIMWTIFELLTAVGAVAALHLWAIVTFGGGNG